MLKYLALLATAYAVTIDNQEDEDEQNQTSADFWVTRTFVHHLQYRCNKSGNHVAAAKKALANFKAKNGATIDEIQNLMAEEMKLKMKRVALQKELKPRIKKYTDELKKSKKHGNLFCSALKPPKK